MASIELQDVWVRKSGAAVLRGLDLSVADGELVALVGTTGSGKSTVLRTIAGLEPVASGHVLLGGDDVTTHDPSGRDVAFVAQEPNLFPDRSVRANLAFPLDVRHEERARAAALVDAEARSMRILALLDRSPATLSAGETRAVQIARAIVRRPGVLLLDQPFAHLDPARAGELRREVSFLRRGYGITTLVATNDTAEAMTCDRIAVLEAGRVSQSGQPLDVYERPRTAAAALLTGDADLLDVEVVPDRGGNGVWLRRDELAVRSWRPALAAHAGRRLQLVVRPEWWERDDRSDLRLQVDGLRIDSGTPRWWCRVGNRRITVAPPRAAGAPIAVGDTVGLRLVRSVVLDPLDGFAIDP